MLVDNAFKRFATAHGNPHNNAGAGRQRLFNPRGLAAAYDEDRR